MLGLSSRSYRPFCYIFIARISSELLCFFSFFTGLFQIVFFFFFHWFISNCFFFFFHWFISNCFFSLVHFKLFFLFLFTIIFSFNCIGGQAQQDGNLSPLSSPQYDPNFDSFRYEIFAIINCFLTSILLMEMLPYLVKMRVAILKNKNYYYCYSDSPWCIISHW